MYHNNKLLLFLLTSLLVIFITFVLLLILKLVVMPQFEADHTQLDVHNFMYASVQKRYF